MPDSEWQFSSRRRSSPRVTASHRDVDANVESPPALPQESDAVSVANSRAPETLSDLAAETGAKAVSATEAARGMDLVVVTIPETKVPSLPHDLFAGASDSLVVVDTGNCRLCSRAHVCVSVCM
jgi:predicted dinucleotide-binding enzyme